MKLFEITGDNVIDIKPALAAKRRKNIKFVVSKIDGMREQAYKDKRQATQEFAELEQQLNNIRATARIPGFETLSDIFYYLVIEARFPTHTIPTVVWFNKQPANIQSRIKMIVFYAPHIIKAFNKIRKKLREFHDKWFQVFSDVFSEGAKEIIDGVAYLDIETQTDLELFNSVVTLIQQVEKS